MQMINLDGLKWVTYKGTQWTIAGRTTTDRSHYHNKKKDLVGGLELTLKGIELTEYKALHLAGHGEALKCPRLLVIDRERVLAYLEHRFVRHELCQKGHPQSQAYCNKDLQVTPTDYAIESTEVARQGKPTHVDSAVDDLGNEVPEGVLHELVKITKEKGLHWANYSGGVYLPMVEACMAKGMEKDDYSSNWQGKLPGVPVLLEGNQLELFKASYIKQHGTWPHPHTRSLRVGNWEHAYAYLVQGKSPTATTFQTMGAKSIQQSIVNPRDVGPAPQCPESWSSEEGLVDRVFKLMELSTISMQREACFFNSLGNTPTTRRVDAVEHIACDGDNPAKVHVYEFKKHGITAAHVSETVGSKGYVHLARERYPEAKVCLFMVGNSIDPQAQRLLDCMLGVMYLPLSTLLNRILTNIVSSWPREGHYQLKTHFLSQFQDILPPTMICGPVPHPQIIATYHKPSVLVKPTP